MWLCVYVLTLWSQRRQAFQKPANVGSLRGDVVNDFAEALERQMKNPTTPSFFIDAILLIPRSQHSSRFMLRRHVLTVRFLFDGVTQEHIYKFTREQNLIASANNQSRLSLSLSPPHHVEASWTLGPNTPQAFSHFTYCHSGGKLLICDIQGVGDKYTDPQIHRCALSGPPACRSPSPARGQSGHLF